MKRILLLILLGFIVGVAAAFALTPPTGDTSSPNAVVTTITKKLNVRQGPGPNYGIVTQIESGEMAWVVNVDDYNNGWVIVDTGHGTGYVAMEYLLGVNGDYYSYVRNYNGENEPAEHASGSYSTGYAIIGALATFMEWLIGLPVWLLIIIAVVLIGGEVFTCTWLREEYDGYGREQPGTLYLFIIPLFLIVLAILPMAAPAASYGRYGSAVWLGLLMCFLPLLINCCWYLEENGKECKRTRISGCYDAIIGKTISIITMLMVAMPLATSVYNTTDRLMRNNLGIPDTFLSLVITLAAITAVNYGILRGWMLLIDRILRPLHNFSIMLVSTGLFFIVLMAEKDIIEHFYGFYFVLALLGLFFNACMFIGFYKALRCVRCANCHRFEGYVEGTTDRGYNVTTSDSWDNISDSSINSSRNVRNAQALRRTYTTWHNWTDHYCCSFCDHRWSMFESESVASETHTLKKRWEEYD